MPVKAYSYIRMSSEPQLLGDSRRRQIAASVQYAQEHGLELVDPIRDEGVSAFRGSHREFGNLSQFLAQVEHGHIEPGSYLLVESLDRLSRENVWDAFALLGKIVSKGIKVVTLIDRQVYSTETGTENQGQIFLALGSMLRAHDESKVKSVRSREAWTNKRRSAATTKMTRTVPAWLKLSDDRRRIEVIQAHANTVREIFQMARDGYGANSITRKFNAQKRPTFTKRATMWHESYIKKILDNRAVLGEYHPHHTVFDGTSKEKRVPEAGVVSDYYPVVVDRQLFAAAQAAISTRKVGARGRKGPYYSNLFTGLLRCGHCGRAMWYGDKGKAQYKYVYLRCAGAKLNTGCASVSWHYETFERSFMTFLRKVDLRYVLGGQRQDQTLAHLRRRELALREQIARHETAIENLLGNLEMAGPASHHLARKAGEHELERSKCLLEVHEVAVEIDGIERRQHVMSVEELGALMDKMATKNNDDDDALRRLLASEIRRVVKHIELFYGGNAQPWDAPTPDEASRIEQLRPWERKLLYSYYVVHYVTGESEYIEPINGTVIPFGSGAQEQLRARLAASQSNPLPAN
jgi:DNA invertase Pin-like site-specific DNA recombinase